MNSSVCLPPLGLALRSANAVVADVTLAPFVNGDAAGVTADVVAHDKDTADVDDVAASELRCPCLPFPQTLVHPYAIIQDTFLSDLPVRVCQVIVSSG